MDCNCVCLYLLVKYVHAIAVEFTFDSLLIMLSFLKKKKEND